MSKFKVGDKVRFKKNALEIVLPDELWWSKSIQTIMPVWRINFENFENSVVDVKVSYEDARFAFDGTTQWWYDGWFELAIEEPIIEQLESKVKRRIKLRNKPEQKPKPKKKESTVITKLKAENKRLKTENQTLIDAIDNIKMQCIEYINEKTR